MYPYYNDEMVVGLISGFLSVIPSLAFGIATYVLTAWGLYTVAVRRGLKKPWLAWIPVVQIWLIGSLSDQYRYVVRGEIKSKRKVLLVLGIVQIALSIGVLIVSVELIIQAVTMMTGRYSAYQVQRMLEGPMVGLVGLLLPILGVGIALTVIRYMAMYDIYKSMDPDNCVAFLVLSILFSITEPFFLFFNRNKDKGMPPRADEAPQPAPAAIPESTWQPTPDRADPWD